MTCVVTVHTKVYDWMHWQGSSPKGSLQGRCALEKFVLTFVGVHVTAGSKFPIPRRTGTITVIDKKF